MLIRFWRWLQQQLGLPAQLPLPELDHESTVLHLHLFDIRYTTDDHGDEDIVCFCAQARCLRCGFTVEGHLPLSLEAVQYFPVRQLESAVDKFYQAHIKELFQLRPRQLSELRVQQEELDLREEFKL